VRQLDDGAAGSPPPSRRLERDDLLAPVDQRLKIGFDVLPRLVPVAKEGPKAFVPVENVGLTHQAPRRSVGDIPLDFRVIEVKDMRGVVLCDGGVDPAHDLYVLLRHRARSISPSRWRLGCPRGGAVEVAAVGTLVSGVDYDVEVGLDQLRPGSEHHRPGGMVEVAFGGLW
jgi:hypothetical protein